MQILDVIQKAVEDNNDDVVCLEDDDDVKEIKQGEQPFI